jgi:hypothetical protein
MPTNSFDTVFQIELSQIRRRREPGRQLVTPETNIIPTADFGLTGIALSGGGVRSASFALGVLQALGAKNLIKKLDYLSTVSGGGYIGTAMTIAMSENGGAFPFAKTRTDSDETPETRHLRDNSRYLIQNGLVSVVSAIAVYLRGFVMNLLVVLPIVLTASLALMWLHEIFRSVKAWALPEDLRFLCAAALSILLGAAFFAVWAMYAIVVSVFRIRSLRKRQLLSWSAAMILSALVLLAIVELHVWLLDVPISPALEKLRNTIVSFSALALAALPFVKRIASAATKGTEDAGWMDAAKRLASSGVLILVAAVVPLGLWLATMLLARAGLPYFQRDPWEVLAWGGGAAVVLFLAWQFLSVGANSLHQLYRDRLGSAFLMRRKREDEGAGEQGKVVKRYKTRSGVDQVTEVDLISADDFRLSELNPERAPYHLINAALNVPGSKFANMRGRNADFFLFSPRFIGSELTGYVRTEDAEKVVDRLNIGTAMAVSGAAVAPNMGMASMKPLSPTIAFFNIRLGRWLQHPQWIAARAAEDGIGRLRATYRQWRFRYPRPRYLLREAFSKSGVSLWRQKADKVEGKGFLFLTDGGHIENLGVYELLRRRCKLIVVVDGEADPSIQCHSLVQLQRLARIDLNTRIAIQWHPIGERTRKVGELVKKRTVSYAAGPHVALGVIDYPPLQETSNSEQALLIYIKASLSGDENDYVMGYKAKYPSFPHETTADQIFREEQLEAYRALGEHIAKRFLKNEDCVAAFPEDRPRIEALLRDLMPLVKPKFL